MNPGRQATQIEPVPPLPVLGGIRRSYRIGILLLGIALLAAPLFALSIVLKSENQLFWVAVVMAWLVPAYCFPAIVAWRRRPPFTRGIMILTTLGLGALGLYMIDPSRAVPATSVAFSCWLLALVLSSVQLHPKRPLHYYSHLMDMDDEVWAMLLPVLDGYRLACTPDGEDGFPDGQLLIWLREINEVYNGDELLRSLVKHLGTDTDLELYWFARAGIRAALPQLLHKMDSGDFNKRCHAALAIAHLRARQGFDFIEGVLAGRIVANAPDNFDPNHYFAERLSRVDDDRAMAIFRRYSLGIEPGELHE